MQLQIPLARRLVLMVIVGLGGSFSCSPSVMSPSPTAAPSGAHPECRPSAMQTSTDGFVEVHGSIKTAGDLWVMFMFSEAQAKKDLKFVWRMTGSGEEFSVQASDRDGHTLAPIWGPEAHTGSNWARPGDEWGAGFNFPTPGCWTLTARRGSQIGEIRMVVAAP